MSGKINYSHSSSLIKSFRTPQRGSREYLRCTANKAVSEFPRLSGFPLCHPRFCAEIGASAAPQRAKEPQSEGSRRPPWWDLAGCKWHPEPGLSPILSEGDGHLEGQHRVLTGAGAHPPATLCSPLVCDAQVAALPIGNEGGKCCWR